MKTKKYIIPVIIAFVFVGALLAQATMSDTRDQSDIWIKELFPKDEITDRHAFFVGAWFAEREIRQMRYKEYLNAPREKSDLLAGLKGVQIIVENVNPKVEQYGLTRQLLQTDTELRLRQNGIRILTDDEVVRSFACRNIQHKEDQEALLNKFRPLMESLTQQDSDDHFLQYLRDFIHDNQQRVSTNLPPDLGVNVNVVVFEESHRAAFSINVRLREGASLWRNDGRCSAAIWEKSCVAGCSTSRLKEYVRECLRDFLDEFINDYLAANPIDRLS